MKLPAILLISLIYCSVSFGTTYYSDSGFSNPNSVSNWWTNTDNTGTHPADFSGGTDVFWIQAGHTYSTTNTWSVIYDVKIYGVLNASHNTTIGHDLKLYTGGGLLNIAVGVIVDVDEDIKYDGDITFTGAGSLYVGKEFENTGMLTSAVGCSVKYKTNGSSARTMKAATYYHLIVDKSTGIDVNLTGTANVNGDLTITSGDIDIRSGAVLNVTGTTTIATNGLLQFADETGDVNLGVLNMTGGQLGYWDDGMVDCTVLTITGTTNVINRVDLTVSGATTLTGTLDFDATTGTKIFQGDFTVNGTFNNTAWESVHFQGDFINNGTFNGENGYYYFEGTGKSIEGTSSPTTFWDVTVDGTYTNNLTTLIILDDLEGTGTLTNAANKTIEIGDEPTITTLVATASPNTIKYNGSGTQDVKLTTYHHLIIDKTTGSEADVTNGTLNINGDLTLSNGNMNFDTLSIMNVSGSTIIDTDGLLWFDYSHGITQRADINLQSLSLTGGILGSDYSGYDWGYVDCTSLTVTGTTNQINRVILTVSGLTQITGTVDLYDDGNDYSLTTFQGTVTVDGTFNNSDWTLVNMGDDLIVNGTFDGLKGTYTFTGTSKSIGGSATKVSFYEAFFDGTYTNNVDTLTITDDLEGSGSLTNATNGVLEIGDDAYYIATLVATAVPNTVIFNGTGTQWLKDTDYYNLIINNSGGGEADIDSDVDVANHLHIMSGWFDADGSGIQLTGKDLTIDSGARLELQTRGSTATVPQFTGTYTLDVNSTIEFDHASTYQSINCTGITYGNVVFSGGNSDDKDLQGNLDVNGDLTISGETKLDASGGNYIINLAGDWISTSTDISSFVPGTGKVIFDGSGSQQITRSGDDGEEDFYDLTISNSGNTVTINNNIKIDNQLDFTTSGFINLNSNTLTINNWDNGDIVTLGTDRYVIGDNSSTFTINGVDNTETVNFPMGFSNSSTDFCRVDVLNNDGANTSFSVSPCNYLSRNGSCSGGTEITTESVDITWNITSSSTDSDVSVFWDTSKELAGFNRSSCDVFHHSASGWLPLSSSSGSTNLSGTIYYRTENTTSFSPFTMGSNPVLLPVELIYFNAFQDNNIVVLNWETATEINNDYFTIERSINGLDWNVLNVLDGAGNSYSPLTYSTIDENPYNGTSYYRLKQTDFNGEYKYSQITAVNSSNELNDLHIHPNPAIDNVIIEGTEEELLLIKMYNGIGQDITRLIKISLINKSKKLIDLTNLRPGIYIIKTKTSAKKVYKE